MIARVIRENRSCVGRKRKKPPTGLFLSAINKDSWECRILREKYDMTLHRKFPTSPLRSEDWTEDREKWGQKQPWVRKDQWERGGAGAKKQRPVEMITTNRRHLCINNPCEVRVG